MRVFWSLVVDALRAIRLTWMQLVAWLIGAKVVTWLLFNLAVMVGSISKGNDSWQPVAGTSVFALSVIAQLVGVIGILLTIDSGFRPNADHGADVGEVNGKRVLDAIAGSLLPFVVFYGAWGLFHKDFGVFQGELVFSTGSAPILENPRPFFAAALACFGARLLLESRWRSSQNPVTGVTAAIFEGLWMVLAFIGLTDAIRSTKGWIGSRVVTDQVTDYGDLITTWLDAVPTPFHLELGQIASGLVPLMIAGLLLPLIWLVIGAVVFGVDVYSEEELVTTRPVRGFARLILHLPAQTRRFLAAASNEVREKYSPMFNAIRLIIFTGIVFFLAYAATYTLSIAIGGWAQLGAQELIGPQQQQFWSHFSTTISLTEEFVGDLLRLAMVAVAARIMILNAEGAVEELHAKDLSEDAADEPDRDLFPADA